MERSKENKNKMYVAGAAILAICVIGGVMLVSGGKENPEPTVTPTISPTPEVSVEPTVSPTPEVTVEPTPEVTVEPTPEVTVEPTPEPTKAPTPKPTLDPEDANADKDGDGVVNWKEWEEGSNYEDASSKPGSNSNNGNSGNSGNSGSSNSNDEVYNTANSMIAGCPILSIYKSSKGFWDIQSSSASLGPECGPIYIDTLNYLKNYR